MPTIVFEVDLETVSRQSHVAPTNTLSEADNYKETRNTWFPDDILNNRKLKHGDQFTVDGVTAVYLRDNFTEGVNAFLNIISTSI